MLRSHNVKDKIRFNDHFVQRQILDDLWTMIGYYDAIKLIFRKRRDFLAIVFVCKVMLRVLY